MLSFLWPWMALLLPLPIIFWFLLKPNIKKASSNTPEILFPYTERLQSAFTTKSTNTKAKSNFWFVISLSLLWVFLVLSIMRPELIDTSNQTNRKGYDIMMAVDISLSMNLLDFSTKEKKVTRLDVVKEVVSNFIKTRHGDRLGLILFGEHAYLQVPMTLDSFAMLHMLNNSIAGMAGPSTAIGDAIGIAIAELRRRTSESKVFILLTDGTDNSSNLPPLEAAQIAEKYGIRIYTIGVGSDNTMSSELAMQTDGNLVLYNKDGTYWSSSTFTKNTFGVMRNDGQFVLYSKDGNIVKTLSPKDEEFVKTLYSKYVPSVLYKTFFSSSFDNKDCLEDTENNKEYNYDNNILFILFIILFTLIIILLKFKNKCKNTIFIKTDYDNKKF